MALVLLMALAVLLPRLSHAQAPAPQNDLRAVIHAELLGDPRTAGLSQAQLNTMVELLTKQAQKQGVTAHDITWRPQSAQSGPEGQSGEVMDVCGASTFFCVIDEAFGLVGPDTTIPFSLGAASMGLIWIIAETLHRRRHGIHSKL